MDAAVWANLIAGLALVVAVATLVWSRVDVRAARRSAADADARADRATRAAEESARAHREIADATPKPRVEWSLSNVRGKQFELVQSGERDAHEVEISATNAVRFNIESERPDPMPKGASVRFFAAGSMQTGTPEVVVKWRDEVGGPVRSWRRVVP